jgi:hypothetical protein
MLCLSVKGGGIGIIPVGTLNSHNVNSIKKEKIFV